MSRQLAGWTADELIAELRRRERDAVAGLRRATTGQEPRLRGRAGDLADVATPELVQAVRAHQRVVYGADERQDLHHVSSARVNDVAQAVAALVKRDDLHANADGSFALATSSYRADYHLCDGEPFADQPLGCFCSGFLVAADVLATAGHCVKSEQDLASVRFVFGFRMLDASRARTTFPSSDVYGGVELIGRALGDDGTDWALVRLDRKVSDRAPLKVRARGRIADSAKLFVIGHPCGLPQKYAPGAVVRDNAPAAFFVANLDTYGGNSGSPVFNATSFAVEGILVRGESDFVSRGNCHVSLVCPTTGCRGEDVTRSTAWAARIPRPAGVSRTPKPARVDRSHRRATS